MFIDDEQNTFTLLKSLSHRFAPVQISSKRFELEWKQAKQNDKHDQHCLGWIPAVPFVARVKIHILWKIDQLQAQAFTRI